MLREAAELQDKIASLHEGLSKVLGGTVLPVYQSGRKRRGMSAAGKARIAAAQRARWAKEKGKKGGASKPKRTMSAAVRAKMAAAAKARWAKAKAEGKKRL